MGLNLEVRVNSSVSENEVFYRGFPHVLGLNICNSDIVWALELRRLRKVKLKSRRVLHG